MYKQLRPKYEKLKSLEFEHGKPSRNKTSVEIILNEDFTQHLDDQKTWSPKYYLDLS